MHLGSGNQLSFDLMIVAQFKCDFPLIWEWRPWRRLIVNCIFSQSRNAEMQSENDSRHDRAKLSQKPTNSANKKLYINFKWSYSSNLIEQNSNYTPVSAPLDTLSPSHTRQLPVRCRCSISMIMIPATQSDNAENPCNLFRKATAKSSLWSCTLPHFLTTV